MDEVNKFARWTLPGAVLLFTAWVARTFSIQLWTGNYPGLGNGVALAAFVSTTLPAGFLLYQWYFWGFSRKPAILRVVHNDFGLEVYERHVRKCDECSAVRAPFSQEFRTERTVSPREALVADLLGSRWALGRVPGLGGMRPLWLVGDATHSAHQGQSAPDRAEVDSYYLQRERNWVSLEEILSSVDDQRHQRTQRELHRLAEIYHLLGVSRISVGAGTILGIVLGTWVAMGTRTDGVPLVHSLGVPALLAALGSMLVLVAWTLRFAEPIPVRGTQAPAWATQLVKYRPALAAVGVVSLAGALWLQPDAVVRWMAVMAMCTFALVLIRVLHANRTHAGARRRAVIVALLDSAHPQAS